MSANEMALRRPTCGDALPTRPPHPRQAVQASLARVRSHFPCRRQGCRQALV